jgi:hypothetical protein
MYLSSSVDAIYGELSEMRDFVAWLNESTEQHSYIVTTEDKFVFEVVRYLDTDFDYHDGLTLFMVFLAVRIDDERVKTAVRSFARNLYVAINRLYRDKCGQD